MNNFDTKINYSMVAIAVGMLALLVGGLWYWQKNKILPQERNKNSGLGAQIFESSQNPLAGKLPDTNPFTQGINPFDTATNPFKAQYKNPFK